MDTVTPDDTGTAPGRQRVLNLLTQKSELPALGASVAKVVQLSSSEDQDIQELANFILSDVSITQRVLRIANSVKFRTASGPCTLISKAIMVIGLDNVRSIALTALLIDKLSDRKKAARLRSEFTCSFFASILAREVAERTPSANAEEVSIGALFKNLGRLLVVSFDLPLHEAIVELARMENISENQAALKTIGMTYDELSAMVVRDWGMPESIAQAVEASPLAPAHYTHLTRKEQAQVLIAFSSQTAYCIAGSTGQQRERMLTQVLRRYGESLDIERSTLNALTEKVGRDTINLTAGLGLGYLVEDPDEAVEEGATDGQAGADNALPDGVVINAPPSGRAMRLAASGAAGAPVQDRAGTGEAPAETPEDTVATTMEILLNYVQEIATTMASGHVPVQEVFGLVLEALYRGMRFKRVLGCLRDPVRNAYRCRTALGAERADMLSRFQFPLTYEADLFHAALAHGTDVHISDATDEKVAARLPAWHRDLLPRTRSFVLLPLLVDKRALGFIYADRDDCDFNAYSKQELDLARTLRSQVLLALRGVK